MNYVTLMNAIVLSNNILNSIFGQGTKNIINDLILAGQILGTLFILFLAVKAVIQRSKEKEEQDRKRYNNWLIALAVAEVAVLGAKEIFNLILSYFGFSIS